MESEKIDDSSVIEKCKKGQLDEFSVLYEKYVKKIYDFIFLKLIIKKQLKILLVRSL
jgi:hypothetical protein